MSDHITVSMNGSVTLDGLRKGRRWLFWSGIAHIVVGVLAIVFPMVASLAANFIIGFLFLFSGVAGLLSCFSVRGVWSLVSGVVLSLLTLAAGAFLVLDPLSGIVALTLVVAVVFVVEGLFQAGFALQVRPAAGWGWIFASAVVSVLVGLLIGLGLPGSSIVVLGVLLGINFLSTGIAALMLAQRIKRATEDAA